MGCCMSGILRCTFCYYLRNIRVEVDLLFMEKKVSKHCTLNWCLKSRVVIKLECMSMFPLQCTMAVKTLGYEDL